MPTATLCLCVSSAAPPTQEELFKGIRTGVGQSSDPRALIATLLVLAGVVIVAVLLGHRRKRIVQPRTLNHQGKLLKEVLGQIDLKSAEVKQLKALAEEQQRQRAGELLLCPSVLTRAVKQSRARVDKRTIVSIARKIV